MSRRFLLVLAIAACSTSKDQVDFDDFSGTASDFDDCHCQYEDGSGQTGDDPTIQIACFGSGAISSISMFIVPGVTGSQAANLQYIAGYFNFRGGGTGMYDTLGPERRDDYAIVRSIDGLDFSWTEQDDCDITHGCLDADTTYHLLPGAAHVGKGQCEDLEAEVADE